MNGLVQWNRRRALRRPGLSPDARAFLEAPWPSPDLPWRRVPFTALDLETSGLDVRHDEILEIGTVAIDDGRLRMDTCWSTLVAPPPGHVVGVPSIRVHGLLPQRLSTAPSLRDVLPALLERLRGRVMVVHVADVDRPFLDRALRQAWGIGAWLPVVDTARLAAWFERHPHLGTGRDVDAVPGHGLAEIARGLGVPVGRQHDALKDALLCGQVLLALASRMEGMGLGSLGTLMRLGA